MRHGRGDGRFSDELLADLERPVRRDRTNFIGGRAADLDRDGEDEIIIVVLNGGFAEILVVDRTGAESYEQRWVISVENSLSRRVLSDQAIPLLVSDMDADGWPDLVGTGGSLDQLVFLRNRANGRFEFDEECSLPLVGTATALAAADFDGDGRLDVVALEPDRRGGEGGVEIVFSPVNQCHVFDDCLFESAAPVEVGDATLLAVEDFTGDGREELLAVGEEEVRLLALRGDGLLPLAAYPVPERPSDLAAADLDADGQLDFAITDTAEDVMKVYFLGAAQALEDVIPFDLGANPWAVEARDVDGDGRADLAVLLSGRGQIVVFLSEGGGRFADARVSEVGHPQPTDFAVGDFDGDGIQDAMVLARTHKSVRFLTGTDDGFFGVFSPTVTLSLPRGSLYVPGVKIERADVDGDGLDDSVVGGFLLDGSSRLTVFFGAETGRFESRTVPLAPARGLSIGAADMLPDRGAEVFVASATARTLSFFQVEKAGGFLTHSLPLDLPLLDLPLEDSDRLLVAAGDFDGDGAEEVGVVTTASGQFEVFSVVDCEAEGRFRRGDTNLGGTVELADAVTVLLYLFAAGDELPCEDAADADDDGSLTLSDPVGIFAYLFSSGAAPAPPGPLECGEDPTLDDLGSCAGPCV